MKEEEEEKEVILICPLCNYVHHCAPDDVNDVCCNTELCEALEPSLRRPYAVSLCHRHRKRICPKNSQFCNLWSDSKNCCKDDLVLEELTKIRKALEKILPKNQKEKQEKEKQNEVNAQ